MIRLFAGLDFPPDLAARMAALGAGLPGARWVPQRNLHLTLRFIGEVDGATAEDIHHELAAIRQDPFALTLSGFGLFGDRRRAHTLWLGVEASEPLSLLARRVDRAAIQGGARPEPRKFTPHVSLARVKEADPARIQAFIAGQPHFRAGPVRVEDFVLYESRLLPGGPEYDRLERYPLR